MKLLLWLVLVTMFGVAIPSHAQDYGNATVAAIISVYDGDIVPRRYRGLARHRR